MFIKEYADVRKYTFCFCDSVCNRRPLRFPLEERMCICVFGYVCALRKRVIKKRLTCETVFNLTMIFCANVFL